MGNLSPLIRLVSVACRHSKQTTRGALWTELCQTPKKISKSSTTANISCCRFCKSVGDASFLKNIYANGNRALLAAAENIYRRLLRQDKLLIGATSIM